MWQFHGGIPFAPKVTGTDRSNFKPILDPPFEKNCRGTPSPLGGALVKISHSLAHVKIWVRSTTHEPKYGLPKESIWVSTISPLNLRD